MKKFLLLLTVFCAGVLFAAPVFEETFENPAKVQFTGLKIENANPGAGKYCAHLAYGKNAKTQVKLAQSKDIIPVEPNQWYRLSIKTRNDVKSGEVKYGLIESRSVTKRISTFADWHWKAVSLNITDWRTDSFEFKTAPNTKGVKFYIRSENNFSGSSWWDDIRLEKFEKKFPPIEIKPFRAAATYVDIPTKMAYVITRGKRNVVTRTQTTYHWETLDLAKEKIEVSYLKLPANSVLKVSLCRGNKKYFSAEKQVSGSGSAAYNVSLDKLPEGIYLFQAELFQQGKRTARVTKELWRIDSRKCRSPRLEPIRKVAAGPGRQRLVNGKIFNHIYASQAPTWGLYDHHKKLCKPDFETYIRNMQEQFGQNIFTVWAWRGPQWDSKRKEFIQKAIADSRAYLDALQKVNCYGRVNIVITPHKKERPDLEEIRAYVRGVKDHPALYGWGLDEPEFRHTPAEMKAISDVVRAEDPNHPRFINLCDPARFHLYAPTSDIGSFDVYPFPGVGLVENQKRTNALLKAYPTAPFDSYLQMFNFKTLAMPSFDQIRSTFLLDRVNGSHSLVAYAWGEQSQGFLTNMELQSYYRAVVSMFRRLEPVLRNPRQQVKLESSHEFVTAGAFQDGADKLVIIVNISNNDFVDIALDCKGSAEHYFDAQWKYKKVNGKYRFRLEPNGSVALRIKK